MILNSLVLIQKLTHKFYHIVTSNSIIKPISSISLLRISYIYHFQYYNNCRSQIKFGKHKISLFSCLWCYCCSCLLHEIIFLFSPTLSYTHVTNLPIHNNCEMVQRILSRKFNSNVFPSFRNISNRLYSVCILSLLSFRVDVYWYNIMKCQR